MKADELIDAIFNMVKGKESSVPTDTTTNRLKPIKIKNQAGMKKAAANGDIDAQKECDGQQTMTFPLQQKLELNKKAVDVPNEFDDESTNLIARIKKMAGVNSGINDADSEHGDVG